MQSLAQPDLVSLASMARSGDRELRPVLLVLQARAFVSAAEPDRRMAASFEALALGLIPLVPDDVVADVHTILNGSPHVPEPVRALLRQRRRAHSADEPLRQARSGRLDAVDFAELIAAEDAEIDVALGENDAVVLDGRSLQTLVSRAIQNPTLALALLARSEPSAFDRAALYRFAGLPERDAIRRDLGTPACVSSGAMPLLSAARRGRILRLAERRNLPGLLAELGKALKVAPAPTWQLDEAPEAELFALALRACGLDAEDCVRVILTVEEALAQSVEAVFSLAEICRTTPQAVARHLVGAGSAGRAVTARASRMPDTAGAPRTKRAESARALASSAPPPRSRGPRANALPGRRSKSTTDRDRS